MGIESIKDVEKTIQKVLKTLKIDVEVTSLPNNEWSFAGKPNNVKKAVKFLTDNKLMKKTGENIDEEDPKYYVVYMKGIKQ